MGDAAPGTGTTPGGTRAGALGPLLRARAGQVALGGRALRRDGRHLVLDHLLATRSGGLLLTEAAWPGSFSVADGHLVRHRSGPGGEWARQQEDDRVDEVRRTAEAAELALGRPLEPVLVLTGGPTAFAGATEVRGVQVVALRHLDAWLDTLPPSADQAAVTLLAARMERTFPPAAAEARTPAWASTGPSSRTLRSASSPSAGGAPAGVPRRRRPGRLLAVAGIAALGLTVWQAGVGRSVDLAATGWDRATTWASQVGGAVPPALTADPALPADPALQPPVAAGSVVPGSVGAVAAEAPPPPAPAPAAPPVTVPTCLALPPDAVGAVLGQPVVLLGGSTATTCSFGPFPDAPDAVWVSVAVGPGSADLVTGTLNGWWTHTRTVGTAVPGAPGTVLGTELSVAVDMGLYPDGDTSAAVADAVVARLAAGG